MTKPGVSGPCVERSGLKGRYPVNQKDANDAMQAMHRAKVTMIGAPTASLAMRRLFAFTFVLRVCCCSALALQPAGEAFTVVSRNSDGTRITFSSDGIDGNDGDRPSASDDAITRKTRRGRQRRRRRKLLSAPSSTFLPSLPEDRRHLLRDSGYLEYILMDNLQDLTTALRSVLATQRVLEGVGVGREGATALAATLDFLIRDGCGMVASLVFTSGFSPTFRRDIKRWKLFADAAVDAGITLEVVAPSLPPGWFLPVLCGANVCKALCGVAAGAVGGPVQLHWAARLGLGDEGLSEVAAKAGAQRTVVGAAGLVLSGLFARWMGGRGTRGAGLWVGMYTALTALHLAANYRSMRIVRLEWLNRDRMDLVLGGFLGGDGCDVGTVGLMDPAGAARVESLVFRPRVRQDRCRVRLGVSFNDLAAGFSNESSPELQSRLIGGMGDGYVLAVCNNGKRRSVLVSFLRSLSRRDIARIYLHAKLVERAFSELEPLGSRIDSSPQIAQAKADSDVARLWPKFEKKARAVGWDLDKTEIATEGYEVCIAR